MEKLIIAKLHIGLQDNHELCGGAMDDLADEISDELELNLEAVANNIKEKFGNGKLEVIVEI